MSGAEIVLYGFVGLQAAIQTFAAFAAPPWRWGRHAATAFFSLAALVLAGLVEGAT